MEGVKELKDKLLEAKDVKEVVNLILSFAKDKLLDIDNICNLGFVPESYREKYKNNG